MTLPHSVTYRYDDYLRIEEESGLRHEFFDGVVYAMAGGSPRHAELAANLIRALGTGALCHVYTSDLRVRIDAVNVTTYPDVSVVCGEPEISKVDPMAITNPTLIVEVTSDSSEQYDRGEKLGYYQTLESLREVLIVSHRTRTVWHIARKEGGGWRLKEAEMGEELLLKSFGTFLRVADIYRGIALGE